MTFLVDDTKFLWMPENVVHRQDTVSTIYDNLAIFPDRSVVDKACKYFEEKYGLAPKVPHKTVMMKRTPLLETLIQEYFAERILERMKAGPLEGLTFQILGELLRIIVCPTRKIPHPQEEGCQVLSTTRAIRFIEGNLFGKLNSSLLSKMAHVSTPTLFRNFRRDIHMTPRGYILRRRMEEACSLLKQHDYKVGDVALLVGYEDIAAFSKAFKCHFGKSPLQYARTHTRR